MIPPKLTHIFTDVDFLPELFENQKLLDWYNLFGVLEFEKLLKESKFTMDISKVVRKTELIRNKDYHEGYYFGQISLKSGKFTGIGRLVILDEFFYSI